jgi:hypothetical protein
MKTMPVAASFEQSWGYEMCVYVLLFFFLLMYGYYLVINSSSASRTTHVTHSTDAIVLLATTTVPFSSFYWQYHPKNVAMKPKKVELQTAFAGVWEMYVCVCMCVCDAPRNFAIFHIVSTCSCFFLPCLPLLVWWNKFPTTYPSSVFLFISLIFFFGFKHLKKK